MGRLAPSPTGLLHLGHARTFLVAWLHARQQGGALRVRLEDLDAERVRAGMVDACLRDLEWLGLDWDGPVTKQSEHPERFQAALESLRERDLLYPCACSRRDVRSAASAPQEGVPSPGRYPGTCGVRGGDPERARRAAPGSAALRFRTENVDTRFTDGVTGPQCFNVHRSTGDFLVARRDGTPSYQLAVVVDDQAEGVTEIVRGDDLLPSTAQQRLLQAALGFAPPRWFHLPLVRDAEGVRLAKRHDALSLQELRQRGVDPRALVSWSLRSLGFDVPPRLTPRDAVASFTLGPLGAARSEPQELARLLG